MRPEANTAAAFPLTTATDKRCRSHSTSLRCPVDAEILRPNSATNFALDLPNTPVVSTASGSKRYLVAMEL